MLYPVNHFFSIAPFVYTNPSAVIRTIISLSRQAVKAGIDTPCIGPPLKAPQRRSWDRDQLAAAKNAIPTKMYGYTEGATQVESDPRALQAPS